MNGSSIVSHAGSAGSFGWRNCKSSWLIITADAVPAKGRAECVPAILLIFLDSLRKIGFVVLDTAETVEYRRFSVILDSEGNKVALVEPLDSPYERMFGNAKMF